MRYIVLLSLLMPVYLADAQDLVGTLKWFDKVAGAPQHHAFTDLTFYNGHYYLCNRVGTAHVSMDGVIQLRRSEDMKTWVDCGTIDTIADDRDPHFVVTDDKLYLYFGVWDTIHGEGDQPPGRNKVRSHFSHSEDGQQWSPVQAVYEPGWWLWRVRQFDGAFYSVAYTALRPVPEYRESRLLRSENGVDWTLVSTINSKYMAGEADLWRRDKESLAVLSRTGGKENARLFSSDMSLRVWDDVELDAMVQSPVVAFWFDRIFVAGRGEVEGKSVTRLWELQGRHLEPLLALPSGGDNAYPGLLTIPESLHEEQPRFYISWYSQTDATTGEKEPDGGAGVYVGEIVLHATATE